MTVILTHLAEFMSLFFCNTIRRKVTESLPTGDAAEAYRHHLTNFAGMLDSTNFYKEYVDYFLTYCSQMSYHATYEEMQRDIVTAFCGRDVAAQFGGGRLPIVVKGIFTKTFKEAADYLIKTPNVLDMVANGAKAGREPCSRVVSRAIDYVQTEYLSGKIRGEDAKSGTVEGSVYDAIKEKYRRLSIAYNELQHKFDKTLERYEVTVTRLKETMQTMNGYKTRLREIEGGSVAMKSLEKPTETVVSRRSESSRRSEASHRQETTKLEPRELEMVSELSSRVAMIEPEDSVSNAPLPAPAKKATKKKAIAPPSPTDDVFGNDFNDESFDSMVFGG